ncbi:MAG: cytochrome c [Rhodocyclales bacterium]|nr:cytochrome c [Rhodocyclales bacterium]
MKTRVLAIAVGIGVMASVPVLAAPHSVPTAPKDYLAMKSPLKETADVVEKGQQIYERKCKKCHGTKGDGKGNSAGGMEFPPSAFNAPGFLKGKQDGQLYFTTEKGSPDTDMDAFGPGSEAGLAKDDIWSVIAYIRKAFSK